MQTKNNVPGGGPGTNEQNVPGHGTNKCIPVQTKINKPRHGPVQTKNANAFSFVPGYSQRALKWQYVFLAKRTTCRIV
jgi:hypothetical protein